MNLFFVQRDGSIVTPELTGTILEGDHPRTRSSSWPRSSATTVKERRISIDEWREGAASGDITEVFACGTAAVVTPVGRLAWDGGEAVIGDNAVGAVTSRIRSALLDIQYGRAEDTHGWLVRLV